MRAIALTLFVAVAACGSSSDAPPDPGTGLPDRHAQDAGRSEGGMLEAGTRLDGGGSQTTCTLSVDATIAGTIKTSVDDNFKLYVNGKLVKDFPGLWTAPQTDGLTLYRHPSRKNVVAIEAANALKVAGIDRMIVADLWFDAGVGDQHVVTDATWLRSPGGLETNWFALDFAEANWTASTVEGTHGDPPYGAILGTSTAKYLWSYDSAAVDITQKPDAETVYFRKTFYIDLAGAPTATPGDCL